jgi:hypothetical protein
MERKHYEGLGIDKRMLKWILKKQDGSKWTALTWLRLVTSDKLL